MNPYDLFAAAALAALDPHEHGRVKKAFDTADAMMEERGRRIAAFEAADAAAIDQRFVARNAAAKLIVTEDSEI